MTLSPGSAPVSSPRRVERRALLVCEYFPPALGGASRWAADLVDHSDSLRWTVLTRPPDGAPESDPDAPPALPVRESRGRHWVIRLPAWRVRPSTLSWRTAAAAWVLRAEIDRLLAEGIEVVHAMPPHFSGLAALGPCRRRRVPLVVHVLGEEIGMLGRRASRRMIFRRVLSRADAVLSISPSSLDAAQRLGARAGRTRLLVAVDTERFSPPSAEARAAARKRWRFDDRRVLLTVARIVERKGIDRTIEAVARLAKEVPDLHYAVAGEGPDRLRLEGLARASGIADRVRFLGVVPEGDLPGLYGAADLFVMPNREIAATGEVEGFGLVFVEAAACGVPSVAGRSGGAAYAVVDGETGLVVDPGDSGAVAAAVRVMLDDDRRRRMGEAARRRAETEFSWRRVTPEVESLGRNL